MALGLTILLLLIGVSQISDKAVLAIVHGVGIVEYCEANPASWFCR